MIKEGQVWRDTYGHKRTPPVPNHRTVRVVAQEADGRWRVVMLTNTLGEPPKGKGRETRLKPKTLIDGYELISNAREVVEAVSFYRPHHTYSVEQLRENAERALAVSRANQPQVLGLQGEEHEQEK